MKYANHTVETTGINKRKRTLSNEMVGCLKKRSVLKWMTLAHDIVERKIQLEAYV